MPRTFDQEEPHTRVTQVYGGVSNLHLHKCKLVRRADDGQPIEFVFDQPLIEIGSLPENDLVLDEDTVSRKHCQLVLDGEQYVVRDLDSTNGTFVNRIPVREATLIPGCTLSVGSVELGFHSMDEHIRFAPSARDSCGQIVGRSLPMRAVFGVVEKIAPTNSTVVLEGETGTGKEVVARTVHMLSTRAKLPFVVVDCGAIPDNLIESELFGHERGSFSGAVATRQGLFELANGSTIFLDEIGELRMELQPKLLRVLEQREIRRVGGNKPIKVDVRVLAATNRDLQAEVKAGRFREDLYYRLSVVRLRLPPLRDRKEDIPLLVKHFLRTGSYNRLPDDRMRIRGVSRDALDALVHYDWPGNIRELLNIIERSCSLSEADTIQISDLPEHLGGVRVARPRENPEDDTRRIEPVLDQNFKEAKEEWVSRFEKAYLADLMRRHTGNLTRAAKDANVDRKHLRRLLRKYGLHGDGEGASE